MKNLYPLLAYLGFVLLVLVITQFDFMVTSLALLLTNVWISGVSTYIYKKFVGLTSYSAWIYVISSSLVGILIMVLGIIQMEDRFPIQDYFKLLAAYIIGAAIVGGLSKFTFDRCVNYWAGKSGSTGSK